MLCSTSLFVRNDDYVSDLRLFSVKKWRLAAIGMYLDAPRRVFLRGACNG